jgi:polyhydroxyalkanoate synthesis regulator phasin
MSEGNKEISIPEQESKKNFSNNQENKKLYGKSEDAAEDNSKRTEYGLDSYEQNKFFKKKSGNRKIDGTYKSEAEKDKTFNHENTGFQDKSSIKKGQKEKIDPKNWIASDEEIRKITDPKFKFFIDQLSQIKKEDLTVSFLLDRYGKTQDLIFDGKINAQEAKIFMPRVINQIREVTKKVQNEKHADQNTEKLTESIIEAQTKSRTKEITLDLPRGKEEQLKYVRGFINSIENSNRDSHDFSISYITQAIEASLGEMEPIVRDEVEARLSLHDCADLIKQANGWISRDAAKVGGGYTIGSAASEALRRGHDLTRKKIKTLLSVNGIKGLNVAQAWDKLQDVVFNYRYFLEKLGLKQDVEKFDQEVNNGKVPSNFFTESDSEKKEIVRNYILGQLDGDENAREKSFQLAEKLALATLETSVFNTSLAGNDELGDIIYLKKWRQGRGGTGRSRGPKIHENLIPGFGKSWLRNLVKEDIGYQLYSDKILDKIEGVKKDDYSYFCSVFISRFYALKELILDRAPKPKAIDKNFLQSAVIFFNTADRPVLTNEERLRFGGLNTDEESGEANKYLAQKKCGPLKLRALWLAGVVDVALAKEDLGWDAMALRELKKAATMEELSPGAGTFITPEQWDWIENKTNFKRRSNKLFLYRVAVEAFKNLKFGR